MPELRSHEAVSKVAVVGAGLIGAGWAVQFLLAGLRVVAFDSAAGWSDRFPLFDSVRGLASGERSGRAPLFQDPLFLRRLFCPLFWRLF